MTRVVLKRQHICFSCVLSAMQKYHLPVLTCKNTTLTENKKLVLENTFL